ncbi:MAG: putative rane protein [Mycobacterium sp.]|nr:putative rane protein [Mycobacterium sp.]
MSTTEQVHTADGWQRLSPRMLLVHPVHEVLRQLPVLVGSVILGSTTGNQVYPLVALGLIVGIGLLRWVFTTYRLTDDYVEMRTGMLRRRSVSVPRNRIRSVQTDSRLLHRLLGLTVVRVGTGHESHRESSFALDAVRVSEVPRLRAVLLEETRTSSGSPQESEQPAGRVLARWQPLWLRYAPLSFSGLLMIAAALGVAYQAGIGASISERVARVGVEAAHRTGIVVVIGIGVVGLVVASVVLAVLWSWLTYGGLVLSRESGALHLRHGLLRVREHTFDMSRLRGGTLSEQLAVRAMRGARLDAVMTGVHGEGESSVLLPACPSATATAVLSELIDNDAAVTGPLQRHGLAAARRRWTRGLALPVLVAIVIPVAGLPFWVWFIWAGFTVACALLTVDRVRSLGHRVEDGWLVARSGSVDRRRDCIACAGIIGWTVRQTFFQRRAGVATLIAATAAGRKHYRIIDVPAELAWSVASKASPWVAHSVWARG